MPYNWRTTILCPIHKKGDKLPCSNYRGIFLLYVCYNVFTNILHRRLVLYAGENLEEFQVWYWERTVNYWKFICVKICSWKGLDLRLLNIDFKQACDSTNSTYLHEILKDLWVPKKLANLITMTLQNPRLTNWSIWHRNRLETRWCTVDSTVQYCTGEGDKEYRDQFEWNNF